MFLLKLVKCALSAYLFVSSQVTAASDPWLHALLLAVKQATAAHRTFSRGNAAPAAKNDEDNDKHAEEGWAVLINTSFNTRGLPILNTCAEALELLRLSADLDLVLVEDWLFAKDAVLALEKFHE